MTENTARLSTALADRYKIERHLGEGGMATVYLAHDLKHDRPVAVKVLRPELAAVLGADRFIQEIKTTANLQHPHILPLFDSGEDDGFLYYVMPYVEGESLRDKLNRDKQLGIEETIEIAKGVAAALDYAHRQGVIHRDIKPENILIHDGQPVVADFGIALAVTTVGGTRLTETGLSLGTPQYMSPEQATGERDVTAKSDVYSLGAVVYEMLVGDPPHTGNTVQAIIAKVVSAEPQPISDVRHNAPRNVDAAVQKALAKVPADRFTSAQEFIAALGNEHFRYGEPATSGAGAAVGPWKSLTVVGWSLAAIFAIGFGSLLLRPDPPRPVIRVSVLLPEGQAFHPILGNFDLSSDGSLIVYRGTDDQGQPQLWARRLDALDATPIPNTGGADGPAISPDGLEVAFSVGSSIRVVSLQGGLSRTLTELAFAYGGGTPRWSPDGAWVYYRDSSRGLSRVPSDDVGELPQVITSGATGGGSSNHLWPDPLPGGRSVVYQAGPIIQAVDLETGEIKDVTGGGYPRYIPTGHLLFVEADGSRLFAAPFDIDRLELTGPAAPAAENLLQHSSDWQFFAVSNTGTLLYRTGSERGRVAPVWVERDGTDREIDPGWTVPADPVFSSLALSPDGTRLALSIMDSDTRLAFSTMDLEGAVDVWVKRLDMGVPSRLTFEGVNFRATWSPDGQSLTFASNRAGKMDLWTKSADGVGTAELVLDRGLFTWDAYYSPNGTWLVFQSHFTSLGLGDIYRWRLDGDSDPEPFVATEFVEHSPAFSPRVRWLAYVSNESGREEIFVRSFPDGLSVAQVSTDGGTEPLWAHSGRELFYRNAADELVAVQVGVGPPFTHGRHNVLFSIADYLSVDGLRMYAVSPDDQRFVMLRIEDAEADSELILVENFFEELKAKVGN